MQLVTNFLSREEREKNFRANTPNRPSLSAQFFYKRQIMKKKKSPGRNPGSFINFFSWAFIGYS